MPDVRFYLTLLWRRLHYVLILTVLGAAAGITLAVILPPTYVASARLVVESEQIPDDLAESTVRTEAVEQLKIIEQRILTRDTLLDMANRFDVYGRAAGAAQPLRPDEIVDDMRERIGIQTRAGDQRRNAPPQATLVNVRFEAADPGLAAAVANEVVTLILQENVEMRTSVSGQTLEFFEQEVDRLDQELSERSARIVRFQESNRDALPDSLEFRRRQLNSAEERLLQVEREEASLRDRRENLEALFRAGGELDADSALTPQEAQLRDLREEYERNLAVYSEQNPRMVLLRSRIAQAEAAAERAAEAAAATAGLASPAGADGAPLTPSQIQLADLDRQIEFAAEQRERLERQVETLQATIEATPANNVTLGALERDYDNLRQQYDQAVARRAQAQTGDTIEALSKGERISVIEQAVAPREPARPDRLRLVMLGTAGGLAAGLGIVALLELLTSAVRRPSEIAAKLDIVPIATLSFIDTRAEILRRRMAIGTAFAVALVGVPGILWGIDTFYMPLDLVTQRLIERIPLGLREAIDLAAVGG